MIVLLHLCGPESKAIPNGQLYSTAQSRDQAARAVCAGGENGADEPDVEWTGA